MIDPVTLDDELRRAQRLKQYQHYQNQFDQMDKAGTIESSGDILGKKVKIAPKDSRVSNLFNNRH